MSNSFDTIKRNTFLHRLLWAYGGWFSFYFRVIAKQGRNEEAKHSRYLDAYNLAQRAVSETEEVFRDVSSLFAANEVWRLYIHIYSWKII